MALGALAGVLWQTRHSGAATSGRDKVAAQLMAHDAEGAHARDIVRTEPQEQLPRGFLLLCTQAVVDLVNLAVAVPDRFGLFGGRVHILLFEEFVSDPMADE